MVTFDTNVIVRILVEDDAAQCRQAQSAWQAAVASGGVFLPTIVAIDTAWVLRSAYQFDRPAIAGALRRLLDLEGVFPADADAIERAMSRFQAGPADFSDYLILDAARDAGAVPVRTFDGRFAREADVELLASE